MQEDQTLDDLFADDSTLDAPAEMTRRPQSPRWRIYAGIAALAAVGAVGYAVGAATADDSGGGAAAGGLPEGFPGAAVDDSAAPAAGGFGGGLVSGELTAIDGDEWLITDSSGQTIRVKVSDDTQYRKTETVTEDDIAIGESVTVIGEEQDDGTVDAANVQSGETGFGGGPPGGGGAPPSGAPTGN